MGNLNSQRLASIADWSALRPFTEMEYEKACRGYNIAPVANEFPWGNTTINNISSVSNAGLVNEAVDAPTNANAVISAGSSLRVGIFARETGATRELAGATYYGVLNMADNVVETCINIVSTQGRAFANNQHGDGYLNPMGNTDIATWNAFQAYGYRGAGFNSGSSSTARVSDRQYINFFTGLYGYDVVAGSLGARMARTAE